MSLAAVFYPLIGRDGPLGVEESEFSTLTFAARISEKSRFRVSFLKLIEYLFVTGNFSFGTECYFYLSFRGPFLGNCIERRGVLPFIATGMYSRLARRNCVRQKRLRRSQISFFSSYSRRTLNCSLCLHYLFAIEKVPCPSFAISGRTFAKLHPELMHATSQAFGEHSHWNRSKIGACCR